MSDLPLLPVYLAGVWPAAGWYIRHTLELKRHPDRPYPEDAEETARDAHLVALDDQLRAGADVVSSTLGLPGVADGTAILDRISGLEPLHARRQLASRLHSPQPTYQVTKPLLALRGLGVASDVERLLALTSTTAVATLPGPYSLAQLILGGQGWLSIATALAALLRGEIETLAASGVSLVQLDETGFAWAADDPSVLADLIRRTVDGIPIEVSLRLGYLDAHGRPIGRRRYRPWLPEVANAVASATINVRQFDLAFGGCELAELDVLQELPARRIGLGLVDVSCSWVEPTALLLDRLQAAMEYVPAERIWVAADGGMGALARPVAIRKVHHLSEAARQARATLGIQEAGRPGTAGLQPVAEVILPRSIESELVTSAGLTADEPALSSVEGERVAAVPAAEENGAISS